MYISLTCLPQFISIPTASTRITVPRQHALIHINALIPQFILCLINLDQQIRISLWTISKPQQSQTEG